MTRAPDGPTLEEDARTAEKVLRGIGVSLGIAIGPVVVLDPRGLRPPTRRITEEAVPSEVARLESALAAAAAEVAQAEAEARERLGPQYAEILAAHAAMIGDPKLAADARGRIEGRLSSAEHAVIEVLEGLADRLEALSDSHLAARAADVRDIEARILGRLSGAGGRGASFQDDLAAPSVILAHDLSPSDAARLDPRKVLGFVTVAGGRASHTAIVASALEIPAVAGVENLLDHARSARQAVVDGEAGLIILDPSPATLERYRAAAEARVARFRTLSRETTLPAVTRDGVEVGLHANIEFVDEAAACLRWGAAGIGLYRTEFLYMRSTAPPTEEEQFAAYAQAVATLQGRPVVIRTLDLGADKLAAHVGGIGAEANPALGLRSLRYSLRRPEIFRTQIRAVLRAAALGDVRLLLPMVTTLDELRRARDLIGEVAQTLRAEGVSHREAPPLGVMVEVPATALMADRFAKEVDFFSIGTNDLIQYTLAVDRTNEAVAELYSAADPAVLRLIAWVVEAAAARGIPCAVCGSMGGELLYTTFLLGLGVRELSMAPHQIPEVRRLIRGVDLEHARTIAAEALTLDTAREVVALLEGALRPDSAAVPAD
jgi:phosphotransferase system enzyme I (PtsI)